MIFSQSLGKRVSCLSTASLCKCSISLATLITDFLCGVAYCYPLLLLVERLVYRPLPLCPAFPDSLGGRDSTDYYGSAAPPVAWWPIHLPYRGVRGGSGVARTAISLSALGTLPLPL